jgi:DNA-binding GntR family transcriptional regulator
MAVPQFRPKGPEYLYVQLADHIAARIAAGELEPDAMLPNERAMTAEYGVSIDTVRSAREELVKRGLVIAKPGKGTFVAGQ